MPNIYVGYFLIRRPNEIRTQKDNSTPTNTPEPTPTSTKIPLPTYTATPTFDLSKTGLPMEPIPFLTKMPSGFLKYDEENYYIYEKVMHNRTVRLVVHKNSGVPEDFREEMAEWLFYSWASAWEIVNGFPFADYTVKISPDPIWAGGEHGIGYEMDVENQPINNDRAAFRNSPNISWKYFIAHNAFHAWNPDSMPPEDWYRNWFLEGTAVYYGSRITHVHDKTNYYEQRMRGSYFAYNNLVESGLDQALATADKSKLSREMKQLVIYEKSNLVCYLIDKRLVSQGYSLDDLLRKLYIDFVNDQKLVTPQRIQATLEEISGEDWSGFFEDYIDGIEPLPLDGTFEYFQH